MEASRSIAVFLGANTGEDPGFEKIVRQLAHVFILKNWKLVYGGSSRGLMGILGRCVAELGGQVHGVKPRPFLKFELDGSLPSFGHHELVDDLYTQKRRMAQLSDTFIVLPGGFGTLEELVTIRMWSKLGVCRKPIILLNSDGYYTPLLSWIALSKSAGFISEASESVITVVHTVQQLEGAIDAAEAPNMGKHYEDDFDWNVVAPDCNLYWKNTTSPDSAGMSVTGSATLATNKHEMDPWAFPQVSPELAILEPRGLQLPPLHIVTELTHMLVLTRHWSTWHTWNHIAALGTAPGLDHTVWDDIAPYSTCVGLSFEAARRITSALAGEDDVYRCWKKRVQILAGFPSDADCLSKPSHCLVAITFEHACVVVDLIFAPFVFVLRLDDRNGYPTLPYITTSGRELRRIFSYSSDPRGSALLTLRKEEGAYPSSQKVLYFRPITHRDALQQMTVPAATMTTSISHVSSSMPTKKNVVIRTLLHEEPTQIPSVLVNSRSWISETCRLQIDFCSSRLTMTLPMQDWLLKPVNSQFLASVQERGVYRAINQKICNLTVCIDAPPSSGLITKNLALLETAGSALGLPKSEVIRVAKSLYDIRHKEDAQII